MADEKDQFWLGGTVKWKATDHWSLKVAEQTRFRDETQYYKHTDLGVGVALNKSWAVNATYRSVEKENSKGDWQHTDGYLLDAVNTARGLGAELKSRMRLACFDPEIDADSSTDFRPRFDLSPAKTFTDWKLKPYAADELMFSFKEGSLYRNRLILGLKAAPVSHLSVNLFVMQECTESGDSWAENWNTGLSATLSF